MTAQFSHRLMTVEEFLDWDDGRYELVDEILSTNEAETRENITRYISLPSIREVALFHSEIKLAERWRRGADGWSDDPDLFTGSMRLDTIDLSLDFDEVYRWVNFRG